MRLVTALFQIGEFDTARAIVPCLSPEPPIRLAARGGHRFVLQITLALH
jgi:hypothetical protein